MSKPTLALIPSGYKSGKVYSILPNDATGDFDFTRQSIGTRVRKDGLIEEAKTVGSITNELLYSEEFTGLNWANVNTTITADQELAPNGTNTADKIARTSTSSSYTAHTISKSTTAKKFTTSVYLKKGSHDYFALRTQGSYPSRVDIRFRFDTEQIYYAQAVSNFTLYDYGVEVLANDWYRLHYSYETDTHSSISVSFSPRHSDGNIDSSDSGSTAHAFVWGAMVSEGALSDYIKTEGSQVTKTVETFTDVPRLDWLNSNCPSLLLEPQRSNILKRSEQFDNATWSKNNSSINSNSIISPNGTLTADKFIEDNTTNTHRLNQIFFSASNDTYTFSVFVKKNGRSNFHLSISDSATGQANILVDLDNGTFTNGVKPTGSWTNVSGGIEELASGWYRVHVTGDKNAGSNIIADLELYNNARNYTGDGISGIYVWGAMLEQASYPTSYIKTEGSTVTRLVDSCEVASGLENLINQTEGVFYIEFEYLYETTTDSSTDANRDILVLGTASDISEGISIDNFRSQFRVFIQGSGMTTQSVGNNTSGSSQPNTRYKLAVNYKSGDNKAYLNGSLLGSVQTGDVNFVTNLDGIFFSYNSSSRPFKNQKKVYDLRVYDTALTDAELIELTT